MINVDLIFVPVQVQMMLIFMLYIYLGVVKSRAIKEGNMTEKKRPKYEGMARICCESVK